MKIKHKRLLTLLIQLYLLVHIKSVMKNMYYRFVRKAKAYLISVL